MTKYFTKIVFIGEHYSNIDEAINLAMSETGVQLDHIVPLGGSTVLLVFFRQPIPILQKKVKTQS